MGSLSQSSIMGTVQTWSLLLLSVAALATSPDTARIITKVEIETNIMYRYAETVVKSTMKNTFDTAQEVTFNMMLPKVAVITNFTITSDGEENVAEVLEREEARKKYIDAQSQGMNAGEVRGEKRNFTISVNVRPQEKIIFRLTYDERLERREGSYRYQIYLNSLPQLDEMSAVVNIKESLTITNITISQANNTNDNWVPGTSDVHFTWAPQE